MQKIDCEFEIKAMTDEGVIEGYASVFSHVDHGGDRVEKGAFTASITKARSEGRNIPVLWNHDPAQPIGVWEELKEDDAGLWGRGRLVMSVARAREAHALMKAGAIGGLSIGYRTIRAARDGNVRVLKEIDLVEASPVTFPMNVLARAEAKSERTEQLIAKVGAGDRLTEREFEDLAKGTWGLSNSQAERAARIHLKSGQGEPDDAAQDALALLLALRG